MDRLKPKRIKKLGFGLRNGWGVYYVYRMSRTPNMKVGLMLQAGFLCVPQAEQRQKQFEQSAVGKAAYR